MKTFRLGEIIDMKLFGFKLFGKRRELFDRRPDEVIPKNKKERCVICGNTTPVDVSTHIDNRLYYVEGCGQLCKYCFDRTYDVSEALKKL